MKNDNTKMLLEILKQHKELLFNIDNKSSVLLPVCSILFVVVTSIANYQLKCCFILTISSLIISLCLLVWSIFPRTKNIKIPQTINNFLYFDDINKYWKNNKKRIVKNGFGNIDFEFYMDIKDEWIMEQIFRICQIIKIKYCCQKISIVFMGFSLLILIISTIIKISMS